MFYITRVDYNALEDEMILEKEALSGEKDVVLERKKMH